jgi:D-mannonate dehydratase
MKPLTYLQGAARVRANLLLRVQVAQKAMSQQTTQQPGWWKHREIAYELDHQAVWLFQQMTTLAGRELREQLRDHLQLVKHRLDEIDLRLAVLPEDARDARVVELEARAWALRYVYGQLRTLCYDRQHVPNE